MIDPASWMRDLLEPGSWGQHPGSGISNHVFGILAPGINNHSPVPINTVWIKVALKRSRGSTMGGFHLGFLPSLAMPKSG